MPDAAYNLVPDALCLTLASAGARCVTKSQLAIAKLQVRIDDPDRWFEEALGIAAPAPNHEIAPGPVACAWLAPGEWLVTGPAESVEQIRLRCEHQAQSLGLMIDLSHARVTFDLTGRAARAVLAAHSPLDCSDAAMPVGSARRSTFGDTLFFVSRQPDKDGDPVFRLIFDQTMAGYAQRLLSTTMAHFAS